MLPVKNISRKKLSVVWSAAKRLGSKMRASDVPERKPSAILGAGGAESALEGIVLVKAVGGKEYTCYLSKEKT